MRISHRYKFIFISKPRCASTTLRTLLDPYSDIQSDSKPPYHHHATALELKLHFETMNWNWKDYFVFTTVRNPWAMMVSYYLFFKPDVNGIYNFEKDRDGIPYQPSVLLPFNEWIKTGKTFHRIRYSNGVFIPNTWVNGFSKLTLSNTVNDINGKSLVDKVYKAEDLQVTLDGIFREAGIPDNPEKIKINATEPFDYHDYYTDETREIVAGDFDSDIIAGKYVY